MKIQETNTFSEITKQPEVINKPENKRINQSNQKSKLKA